MPLKRTYSTSTTVVPSGYQQGKKRRIPMAKRAKKWPASGTIGRPRPFPTRMVATLRYVETIAINSAIVSAANTSVACNSIYDPNLTGTGHQPYGHDTYASIYNQYTVLRSTIKITPFQQSANHMAYGVGIEDAPIASISYDTWAEKPTYKAICQRLDGSQAQKPIVLTWDRNKRFPQNDTYRDLSAPFGANPSEIEVFNICLQSAGSGTAIGNNGFFVEVWYTCEFYELKDLGSS